MTLSFRQRPPINFLGAACRSGRRGRSYKSEGKSEQGQEEAEAAYIRRGRSGQYAPTGAAGVSVASRLHLFLPTQ